MFRLTGRAARPAAAVAVVMCAYAAGAFSGGGERRSASASRPSLLDETAWRIGEQAAAGPMLRGELDRAAIEGMLRRLGDRWARYYSAGEFAEFQGRLDGRYSGVGLWLGADSGPGTGPNTGAGPRVQVAGVRPGSAAERAGVRSGDTILGVGAERVAGWDVSRVAMALRGRPGSPVRLTVGRGGREHTLHLVRTAVRAGDVTVTDPDPRTRMIRIEAFTRGVGREVRRAVTGDPRRGAGGILLDLRGNPGGLLEEAVGATSAFLDGGPVASYERRGRPVRWFTVTEPGDPVSPLVVLVDAGTASAAEVVAGGLRDRDRAVIVGSRTYGKGSVQEPIRLPDGSAIELTVGRYRTPAGRNLDGVGIEPDVEIPADRPPRAAEQRAKSVLRGLLATLPDKDRG
ncbi:S41 family peptidase [Actinomadura viridis]|uniref:S41 family peptidase n=1 Tax=Actinomadura viridis TaxID=58110 RepID=UPI0036C05CF9